MAKVSYRFVITHVVTQTFEEVKDFDVTAESEEQALKKVIAKYKRERGRWWKDRDKRAGRTIRFTDGHVRLVSATPFGEHEKDITPAKKYIIRQELEGARNEHVG